MASILVAAGHGFLLLLDSEDEVPDEKTHQRLEKWRRLDEANSRSGQASSIERSAGQGGEGAQVVVREVAYPGTLLIFGARRSLLLREKPAGRFFWDTKRGRVEFIPDAG